MLLEDGISGEERRSKEQQHIFEEIVKVFHYEMLVMLVRLMLVMVMVADLEFVKKFTRPNFPVKEFYTLKTRKSRLFSPTINSKNTSLSVIWPSFG